MQKDNQPIINSDAKKKIYNKLQEINLRITQSSDIWNWNSLVTLTRPSLQRILHLDQIFNLAKNIPGDIFEFGCYYGASTTILNNLKKIYLPFDTQKFVHTFDTFCGFVDVDQQNDESASEFVNKIGDFSNTLGSSYDDLLREVLSDIGSLDSSVSTAETFTINKGDLSDSLPKFLDKNPAVMASMIIFDMDLFKPTKNGIDLMVERMIPGCILVFDEFNGFRQFPGESLALQKSHIWKHLDYVQNLHNHIPGSAVFRYKP